MKKPKLTPWFAAGTKPVHKGVYETKSFDPTGFQYWDGKRFKCADGHPDGAYRDREYPTNFKKPEWRGLTSKAAA